MQMRDERLEQKSMINYIAVSEKLGKNTWGATLGMGCLTDQIVMQF